MDHDEDGSRYSNQMIHSAWFQLPVIPSSGETLRPMEILLHYQRNSSSTRNTIKVGTQDIKNSNVVHMVLL